MKVFTSRCYVFYGIIITVEKGIGRLASKSYDMAHNQEK